MRGTGNPALEEAEERTHGSLLNSSGAILVSFPAAEFARGIALLFLGGRRSLVNMVYMAGSWRMTTPWNRCAEQGTLKKLGGGGLCDDGKGAIRTACKEKKGHNSTTCHVLPGANVGDCSWDLLIAKQTLSY